MPEVHALTREPRRKCRVGDSCGVCDDSGTVRIGNAESRGRVLRNTQLGYPPPPRLIGEGCGLSPCAISDAHSRSPNLVPVCFPTSEAALRRPNAGRKL